MTFLEVKMPDMKAEGEEGERMGWLDGMTNSMDTNLGKLQERVRGRKPDVL